MLAAVRAALIQGESKAVGLPASRREDPCRILAYLIDVVLLPVQGGVGLDDDALARGLLELLDQGRLARLERLGDFGMDAQGQALGLEFRRHLASLGLNFVADRGDGLHHARPGAVGARLAENSLERL